MESVVRKLNGQGAKVYNAGDVYTVYLETIKSLVSFGLFFAYLRRLTLEVTLAITNNTGGSITINWPMLYRIIKRVTLTCKAAGMTPINMTLDAGSGSWISEYLRSGVTPEYQTDLTIANTNTGTVNLKIHLPFYDHRGGTGEAEDEMILVDLLRDSSLEIEWAPAAIFGANTTITAATQVVVSAEICPRSEIRFPTLGVMSQKQQAGGLIDDLDRANVFYADLCLEPVHTNGQTETKYAAADLTNVILTVDGVKAIDNQNPTYLITKFNESLFATAERLTQWEAGTTRLLPLLNYGGRAQGKKSKLQLSKGRPNLEMVGGISNPTTSLRLFERIIVPSGREKAAAALNACGIKVTDPVNQLSPKASLKNGIIDPVVAMVCPWVFNPAGKAPKQVRAAG